MINCPFCNQPMDGTNLEDEVAFTDLYRCGACQVEQAVHWHYGERQPIQEQDLPQ